MRNPQPKSIGEVSPSGDAILTKTLGEMTILLRQIHQSQQVPPMLLAQPRPPRIEGPSRPCGICACSSHYTFECPEIQEDNTLVVANPYPQRSTFHQGNQGSYPYGGNQGQGQRDNSNQRWQQPSQNHPFQSKQAYYHQRFQNQQPQFYQPPRSHQQPYQLQSLPYSKSNQQSHYQPPY
ncbi:hypothetical protein AHAS_Ahas15G0191800 [Arachis hypogaea]